MKKSSSAPRLNRREFLGQASCAAVGSTALFSTLLSLRLVNSLAAQSVPAGSTDYKALVCLFLAGGNDSFNMLVPTTAGEYAAYSNVRGNLALAQNTLLPLTPSNLGGRTLGLHPSMPEVQSLFTQGKLAFVSNVGSLIQPMTLADYKAGHYLPVSLYSHADQQKQWQTCIPDARTAVGWGGRAADILNSLNTPSLVSMNISLSGQNVFLSGQNAFTYAVNSSGAVALNGYDTKAARTLNALNTAAVDSMLANNYASLLDQTFARSTRDAIDAYGVFSTALGGITLATPVPAANSLASSLAMIAKTAAAHTPLGARRQVFFVQMGGFDDHTGLLNTQQTLLSTVSQAVGFFWTALGELGLQNQVALFTASDFGRTLTSKGNGSDHGWGGNHFVLGGAVKGGQVCGNPDQGYYPNLQNLTQFDTGQGRLIPGVSVDEYAHSLLTWFGLQASDVNYVLPSFTNRFGGRPDLGLFDTTGGSSSSSSSSSGGSTSSSGSSSSGGSSGGGGGGGAISGWSLGTLGALAVARWRQKRLQEARAQRSGI